jgi:hypothetical protein
VNLIPPSIVSERKFLFCAERVKNTLIFVRIVLTPYVMIQNLPESSLLIASNFLGEIPTGQQEYLKIILIFNKYIKVSRVWS